MDALSTAVLGSLLCAAGCAATPLAAPDAGARTSAAAADDADAHLAWWRDARIGLFVHWGPVALEGTEIGWSRGREVPVERYDELYRRFAPTRFDADRWVELARSAGMRYVVLTTKHHDGFSLFDTRASDYDVEHTPFARDVTAELAAACARAGLRFGAYYSIIDWHHADYLPRGAGDARPIESADFERYVAFAHTQVGELLTRYPNVDLLWFDGQWEDHWTIERGRTLAAFCRATKPSVILNDRVAPTKGDASGRSSADDYVGDYGTPEKTISRYRDDHAWETCETICRQWAWKPDDELKSLDELVRLVVRVVGADGNLLLNVGPMPSGEIEPRQAARLAELGAWLAAHGESVYGTRGGPFLPRRELTSTRRGSTIFLHVFDWPAGGLVVPEFGRTVLRARVVGAPANGADRARMTREPAGWRIDVAPNARETPVTTIALELDGSAATLAAHALRFSGDPVSLDRPASASNVYRNDSNWGPDKAVDGDESTRWATDENAAEPWLEVDLGEPRELARIVLVVPAEYAARIRACEVRCELDGRWTVAARATDPGARWEPELANVRARRVRLAITASHDGPTVSSFDVFARRDR
jgi:alpha-L-fucosidase